MDSVLRGATVPADKLENARYSHVIFIRYVHHFGDVTLTRNKHEFAPHSALFQCRVKLPGL